MTDLSPSLTLETGLDILRERRASHRLELELSPRLCLMAHERIRESDLATAVKLYRWAIAVADLLDSKKQGALCSYDLAELLERARDHAAAITCYRRALEFYDAQLDLKEIVAIHHQIAECYVALHAPDQALAELTTALSELTHRGLDHLAIVNYGPRIAELLDETGSHQKANEARTQLERIRSIREIADRAEAQFERAQELGEAGRISEALQQLEAIKADVMEHSQLQDRAPFLLAYGAFLSHAGRFDDATASLRGAIEIFDACGDLNGVAKSHKNLASRNEDLGHYQDALSHYRAALKAFTTLDDQPAMGRTLLELGVLSKNLNLYFEAFRQYLVARSFLRAPGNLDSLRGLRANIDTLLSKLRLTISERLADAVALLYERGDLLGMARLLEDGSAAWSAVGSIPATPSRDNAVRAERGAVELLAAARECFAAGRVHDGIRELSAAALTLEHSGSRHESLQRFQEATRLAGLHGLVHDELMIKEQWGSCLARAGQLEAASKLLDEVVSRCQQHDLFPILWKARVSLADVCVRRKAQHDAIAQLRSALEEVESRASELAHVSTVEGFFSDKRAIPARLVELLLERGDTIGAYEIVLRSKCWPFVRFLPRIRASNGTPSAEQRDVIATARARAEDWRRHEARTGGEVGQDTTLLADWAEMQAWHEFSEEQWSTSRKVPAHRPSMASVQTDLKPADLLLDFCFTERQLHVFLVRSTEVAVRSIAAEQHALWLRLEASGYRRFVDGSHTTPATCLATVQSLTREIVTTLFDEGAGEIQTDRIAICPQGILHVLPMSTAVQDAWPNAQVWQVPHATCVKSDQMAPAASMDPIYVAFGNPEPEIASVEFEINQTAEFFSADRRHVVVGRSTSEEVLARMRTADVLHFACHAWVRSEATELSYLDLGGGRRLRVVDILSHGRTSAQLVFLSACSTTLGRVTPSDEVASLSRAFLYAGAHAVIATLWPIDDEPSARFVIDFFRGWRREHLSLREALARARQLHRARPSVSTAFQLIEAP